VVDIKLRESKPKIDIKRSFISTTFEKGTVMHKQRREKRPEGRPGFTLIELLVVISIIAFLMALLVMIGPALLRSEAASRGAQLLQGNLFIAKQQALRNRAPYGLRLIPDAGTYNVRSFQFIQQPDNFTGGQVSVLPGDPTNPTSPSNTVQFQQVDLSGGLGTDPTIWPVQPGDYFQQPSATGALHLITQVNPPAGMPPNWTVTTAFANNTVTDWTTDYRIIRSPRPVRGEETIYLPDDVVIDLTPQSQGGLSQLPADPQTKNYDILFAPAGSILGPAASNGKIILWVYNTNEKQNNANTAEQSLIVVYTRTGLIASFPVDIGSGDALSFVKDPKSAGGY
jgi:prepilin-type N-terminal cleavage/methylation domain-containing protein